MECEKRETSRYLVDVNASQCPRDTNKLICVNYTVERETTSMILEVQPQPQPRLFTYGSDARARKETLDGNCLPKCNLHAGVKTYFRSLFVFVFETKQYTHTHTQNSSIAKWMHSNRIVNSLAKTRYRCCWCVLFFSCSIEDRWKRWNEGERKRRIQIQRKLPYKTIN